MAQFDPRFGWRIGDTEEWTREEPVEAVEEAPAEVVEEVAVKADVATGGMTTKNAEALLKKGKVS